MSGPLAGVRVVELGGIGPVPFCGMLLGDLGADVTRIDRPDLAVTSAAHPVLHRSRRSITLDLKTDATAVLHLVATADVLIEGFRPGVTERLGVGPEECLAVNPRLVYGRMTGWGRNGPLASSPGHDINYLALTGALHAIGAADGDPVVPLNLVADMGGGGMLLAFGVLAALRHTSVTGRGQIVDAAMIDGVALQLALVHGLLATGRWSDRRGHNVFDGAAPFYRTYRCADNRHVAVGCVEPRFYATFLSVLDLTEDAVFADQFRTDRWPEMVDRLAAIFRTRPRDAWAAEFSAHEACVTPVLDFAEAARHPHNTARNTFLRGDPVQATPAPRFSATPSA